MKKNIKNILAVMVTGKRKTYIHLLLSVVGSILHGGPIELFLVPASAPRLV